MKKVVWLGALVTASLLFTGDARADWFGLRRCCPCLPTPACAPAATASVQGTTSYSATYQPSAAPSSRTARGTTRWKTFEDYRREIKGW